jgi:predicted peptidase
MKRRTVLAGLAAAGSAPIPTIARNAPMQQQTIEMSVPGDPRPLRGWLARPPGWVAAGGAAQPPGGWPLVIFLHGSGERGDDLARVKVHGPPKLIDAGADWPAVVFSPQLEADRNAWPVDRLHAALPQLLALARAHPQRVALTGLSLGGHGVWNWASRHPGDVCAAAPVCGYGDAAAVCAARGIPFRAYHGARDTVVPLAAQLACVQALRRCGGTVDWIVYPEVGHDAWNPAYDDAALMPWLLAERKAPELRR